MRIQHRWQHERCAVRVLRLELRPYAAAAVAVAAFAAAVAAAASSWPKSHVRITHQQPLSCHDGSNAVRRLLVVERARMRRRRRKRLRILRFRIAGWGMDRGYSYWVDQRHPLLRQRVHARPCRRPLPQLQPGHREDLWQLFQLGVWRRLRHASPCS